MKQWLRLATLVMTVLLTGCSNNAHTNNPQGYYSDAELDQMLAPVALYPDMVLSQVLMAATYQPELDEAAYWSQQNPGLRGNAAVDAVAYRDWDPSVKAMVAFPELLEEMASNPDWTWRLGDAYLSQEADVAAAIQRLRQRAYRAGHLNRLDHMRVYNEGGYVIIEPYDPAVVYLPYYQPLTVYGDWWWPSHPPHYWRAPRGYSSGVSFYWGSGITVGTGFFYSGFHWPSRHIVVYDRRDYRPYRDRGYYKHYHNPRPWHYQAHRYPDRHHYDYRRDHNRYKDGYPRSPGGFRGDWERKSSPQYRDNRYPAYPHNRNQDWERQRRDDGRRDQYQRHDQNRDGYRRDDGQRNDQWRDNQWRDNNNRGGNAPGDQRNGNWQQRRDNQQPGDGQQRGSDYRRPEQQQPDIQQPVQERPARGSDDWQRRSEERRNDFRSQSNGGSDGFRPGNRENRWQAPAVTQPAQDNIQQQRDNSRREFDNQRQRPDFRQDSPREPRVMEQPMPDRGMRENRMEMPREERPQRFEAPAVQQTDFPSQVERHQNRSYEPRSEPQRNPRSWERDSSGDGGRGDYGERGGERGGFGGRESRGE